MGSMGIEKSTMHAINAERPMTFVSESTSMSPPYMSLMWNMS